MEDSAKFKIGLEIEGVFKPHHEIEDYTDDEKSAHFASRLASYHNSKIEHDGTIAPMRVHPLFIISGTHSTRTRIAWGFAGALEIVSPIMTFDDAGAWRTHVSTVFELINEQCRLKSNHTCGFHVHISVADRMWELAELKSLSIAILHFEEAFTDLLPDHRTKSSFCGRNSENNELWLLVPEARWEVILGAKSIVELYKLMQDDRFFAWSFENLLGTGTGLTIEWRQPPAVETAAECIMWTQLAVGFVQAARQPDTKTVLRGGSYPKTASGLKLFINDRGLLPGMDKEILDLVFLKETEGVTEDA
ncbi:hypothetical protein BR93DRAFT_939020 [Coniochaeta sp. PMI_546]|nr:hypothetical protein BR93DRAFT_939020 [Coniochaeta sp. PMI_546]